MTTALSSTTSPIISAELSEVNGLTQSTLPTGRIKLEGGMLYQEALVIVHKSTKSQSAGLHYEWIPFPAAIMERIRILS